MRVSPQEEENSNHIFFVIHYTARIHFATNKYTYQRKDARTVARSVHHIITSMTKSTEIPRKRVQQQHCISKGKLKVFNKRRSCSFQRNLLKDRVDRHVRARSDKYDVISAMLTQERTTYRVKKDFLLLPKDSPSQRQDLMKLVDDSLYIVMANWAFDLVSFCGFQAETVAVSLNLLCRFAGEDMQPMDNGDEFQLAAIDSLYISIKAHEKKALSHEQLVKLSRGKFTEQDLTKMEVRILTNLCWRINPPTIYSWVRSIVSIYYHNRDEQAKLMRKAAPLIRNILVAPERMMNWPSREAFAIFTKLIETTKDRMAASIGN